MLRTPAEFKARMMAIPAKVMQEVRRELEVVADQIVAEMSILNPLPGTITIAWKWGEPPKGGVSLGKVAQHRRDGVYITIYATAVTEAYPGGIPAVARWFEFGTKERWTSKKRLLKGAKLRSYGRIEAEPYFFPVWRVNRRRARRRISRAVTRGLKRA